MSQLILYPNDTCQWHALVNDAQQFAQLPLNQDTESYLVFLLMRFSQSVEWLDSLIALDVLNARHMVQRRKVELLCEVGDKSLLFSGLFPGVAQRRRVSLNYYTDMGRAAYLTVSELHTPESAALYLQLGEHFEALQTILQAMRCDYYQAVRAKNSQSVWLKSNSLQ